MSAGVVTAGGGTATAFAPTLYPATLAVTTGVVVRPMASPTGASSSGEIIILI